MKPLKACFILFLCALFLLAGCGEAVPPASGLPHSSAEEPASQISLAQPPPEAEQTQELRTIQREFNLEPHLQGVYLDPMRPAGDPVSIGFYRDDAGETHQWGSLQIYSDVYIDEQGHIMADDSNLLSLVLHTDDGFFPILSGFRSHGSLRVMAHEYNRETGDAALLLSYTDSSGYTFLEYRYDPAADSFTEEVVYSFSSNYVSLHIQ